MKKILSLNKKKLPSWTYSNLSFKIKQNKIKAWGVYFFYSIFFVYTYLSFAQQPNVLNNAKIWILPKKQNQKIQWINKIDAKVLIDSTYHKYINQNPAPIFSATKPQQFSFSFFDNPITALFVIYQSQDTLSQRILWQIQNSRDTTTATTIEWKKNYLSKHIPIDPYPKLLTYIKTAKKENANEKLYLFNPINPKHYKPFSGTMPEIIAYDQPISSLTKQQIESYLAIKYGITLKKSLLGYNSKKIIWDAVKNEIFNHKVAAIAYDSSIGLNQTSGQSQIGYNNLSIRLLPSWKQKKQKLTNDSYLIWGENNLDPISENIKTQGRPIPLKQTWKIQSAGPFDSLATALFIPKNNLPKLEKNNLQYWLMVDKNKNGTFLESNIVYHKPFKDSLGILSFGPLFWGDNKTHYFKLLPAPDFFVTTKIIEPNCNEPNKTADIQLNMQGGTPPFYYELKGISLAQSNYTNHKISIKKSSNLNKVDLQNLPMGAYAFWAQDFQKKTYRDTLYIQPNNAPKNPLLYKYYKDSKESLNLSIKPNQNLTYSWIDPKEKTYIGNTFLANKTGLHFINIHDSNGCNAQYPFWVKQKPQNIFQQVQAFPNPSKDGFFEIILQLSLKTPLTLALYDMNANLLQKHKLPSKNYLRWPIYINRSGVFLLKINAENQSHTLKLIVP